MSDHRPNPSPPRNLAEVLLHTVAQKPAATLFGRRSQGRWQDVSAQDFLAEVNALAKGLIASGINPGDRVGLLSKTRYEWTLCDFALWMIAAIPVPIYETSAPDQIAAILSDSAAIGCIVETKAQRLAVEGVRGELPDLVHVWQVDPEAGHPGAIAVLSADGENVSDDILAQRLVDLERNSLATLIYTSGTTGQPKGCMLTHGNFIAECTSAITTLPELFSRPGAATLLFLPLAHVFGRMIQIAAVMSGIKLSHSDPARLVKDLAATRPTFVLAVPQVFEKIYETARRKAEAAGKGKIFAAATATAIAYSEAAGRPGPLLRLRHFIFDRLVYQKLRAAFGGRAEVVISGGAPLGRRLGHFFSGMGVIVLEGYGLTESTAAATANRVDHQVIGTVGPALDGFEVRLEDGEVLLRGEHIFAGYWNNPEATEAVLDEAGWFHTGDLGTLGPQGFLSITGRLKELIVTAGGKNVAPAAIEEVIRGHHLIGQVMLVGDQQPFIAALVTLDQEALDQMSGEKDDTPPDRQKALRAEVQSAIDVANLKVSSAEQVRRFVILPEPWTEDSGHLTPTMKLKRNAISQDFSAQIAALYARRSPE